MNYSGFWRRLAAYIVDYVLLNMAQIPIYLAFGIGLEAMFAFEPDSASVFDTTAGIAVYTAVTLLSVLYFILMESSAKQATIGKMALGLVVTDEHGGRITPGKALGRFIAKIISSLLLGIGFIMIAFTQRKQGLHDIMCETLVLRGKPGETGVDPAVFE